MSVEIYNLLDGKLFIGDKRVYINEYLDEIVKVSEQILEDDRKANLIVTLDKERIEVILLIVLAIKIFLYNLKNSNKTILDELEPGKIVTYKGKKVKFICIDTFNGDKKIKLAYEDDRNSTEWINVNDYYKLSIYNGKSDKLNVMSSNKSKKKDSGKFLFERLIGINLEEFKGVIEQQIVVTFPSKEYMNQLISNIIIEIDDEKYDFTQVFPCKYYSDIDNCVDLKGNKVKDKELFLFTSRLDIAKALLQANQGCTRLLLLGENTYKEHLGGIFDNLLSRKKLHKIFLHNTFDNISSIDELLERNVTVYGWSKNIINEKTKNINTKQDEIIRDYLKCTTKNILIENQGLNKVLLNTRKNLVTILKCNEQIIDKEKFMRVAFILFKLLQRLSIPIDQYERYDLSTSIKNYFLCLQEVLNKNNLYFTNIRLINSVISNLKELYELLYYHNPKINIIKNSINNKSVIVCNDEIEKEFYKVKERLSNTEVVTIKEVGKGKYNNRDLIFVSFYDIALINQLPYCHKNNVLNILYYSDVIKYNLKVRELNNCIEKLADRNQIKSNHKCEKIETIYCDNSNFILTENRISNSDTENACSSLNIEIEEDEVLIDNYVRNSIKDNYDLDFSVDLENLFNIGSEKCSLSNNTEISEVRKKVIFDDGRYSYLTKNYDVFCIDDKETFVMKNVESLKKGERIIFISEKSEEDLAELFYKIINSDIFKSKYSSHYENMKYWKIALKKYMDNYDMDYDSVAKELKLYNLNNTGITIRQWINDEKIIGPWGKEEYEAISKITRDYKLLDNWETVYESCNIIRGFRTKFKKTFKNMVKSAVINQIEETDELANLVGEVFGDLKEYADVVKILNIQDISQKVPSIRTNCLLANNYNIKNGDDENELVSGGM